MTDFAIRTDALSWRAGRDFALDKVDLRVPTGAVYGFLGPNGAGKTTTIRALLGLLGPMDGKVTVLGHDIPGELSRALARLGYVPERPHLYQHFTVAQALEYHSAFHARWDAPWADEQRRRFALASDREIARLSKGEIGKLMILLALAQRPELLILDEPTDGLDPVVRRDVLSALVEYVDERKATVFISSHLVHELERVCVGHCRYGNCRIGMGNGNLVINYIFNEGSADYLREGLAKSFIYAAKNIFPSVAIFQTE